MYAKIFAQIFDSSIADNYPLRHFFMDLLVLADKNGVVDMTSTAIAGRTRIPLELVHKFLTELERPDSESRTPEHDGKRIARLDEHRSWGWMIINYDKFREIATEHQRREKTAERTRNYRKRKVCDAPVTPCDANVTPVYAYASASASEVPVPSRENQFLLMKENLVGMFNRDPNKPWKHLEESLLVQVVRENPDCLAELAELRNYARKTEYFPKSIASLLSEWDRHLDAARAKNKMSKQAVAGISPAEIAERKKQAKQAMEKAKNYVPT